MTGTVAADTARRQRRLALGRGGWSTFDQGLNSLTNFAVNVIAIHTLSVRNLGSFSIAFTLYTLAWGVSRAFVSEPLIVRWSDVAEPEWRAASADSLGAAIAVGLIAAVVAVAVAPVLDTTTKRSMLAIAVFLPGLLVQDAVRLAFFAKGRPQSAALNDFLWALFLPPLLLVFAVGGRSVTSADLLLAWGAAGTLAGVAGFAQIGALPTPRSPIRWWRNERDLGLRYVGEFASQNGLLRLSDYGVAGVAGLSALGLFRIANVLMGPVRIAVTGLALHAIGEGSRNRAFELTAERRSTLLRYAALIAACGLVLVGVAYAVPVSIGIKFAGGDWTEARFIFAIASLAWVGFAVATVSMVQLRIMANARQSLRAQLWSCVPLAGTILLGAAVDGARGAAVGLAIGYTITGWIWWRHVVTAPPTESGRLAARDPDLLPPDALTPDALSAGEGLL
ncbi:MAG: hypothetical protein JO086_04845 [Acidimicrobiia bacterium]|nr:hypothetical protein [Acidimicrobiia bacterium]